MNDFETHRPLLLSIAYRMLGDRAEAEDIVQDAFLRMREAPPANDPRAYMSTVVTRLCLDHLKSARTRREQYVGPWLPEPLPTETTVDTGSISVAFLLLLEKLSPVERAVLLLHDVFDYSHAEVAEIVGRDEVYCRQSLHRARQHVRSGRPRFAGSRERHEALLSAFASAVTRGDLEGLKRLLAEDVVVLTDGGGNQRAARLPITGADRAARALLAIAELSPAGVEYDQRELNGRTTVIGTIDERIYCTVTIETDGERITAVYSVVNPDKLARL